MARARSSDPELEAGIEAALELFGGLGSVRARKMFGGAGIYLDGLMFALVVGSDLYLKADDTSRPQYLAEGCAPVVWIPPDGPPVTMSYHRLPDSAFDDLAEAEAWATLALASARRAAQAKPPRKPARQRTQTG
jgi:DNA transformation protein and related proteins